MHLLPFLLLFPKPLFCSTAPQTPLLDKSLSLLYHSYMNEKEQPTHEHLNPLALLQDLWHTSKCAEQHVDALLAEVGLSHAKLWGLSHLVEESQPLQLRHLAQRLGGAKSNATQLVDRLAADGLVQRVFDPEDRRNVLVEIMPEGRKRYAQGVTMLEASAQNIFVHFPASQMSQFAHLLEALRTAFNGKSC